MHLDNKVIYDGNWDRWFDQKLYGPASRWLRWLVAQNTRRISANDVHEVIDVGCGQGTMTAMLATLFPAANVLGIDLSEAGIRLAKSSYLLPNLSFAVDAESRKLDCASYDLATCFEVLEHVQEWQSLLGRICRASKRYVMLSYPTGRMRTFEVKVGHVRNFQKGQVEQFMQERGFTARNLFYAGYPFYSPLYRDFCNLVDAGESTFASGSYRLPQKIVSNMIFVMFRYLCFTHVGDQFCGLFERTQPLHSTQTL